MRSTRRPALAIDARLAAEVGRVALVTLTFMLVAVAGGIAWGVELRDAELVAAGSPVLRNEAGSVRLEDPRLGRIGPTVFVPEPVAALQWGAALCALALLTGARRRRRAPRLAALGVCLPALLAPPVLAQVPQDSSFTGRLVDEQGSPLSGPVDLELRVFDAESEGDSLYSEQHMGVALDATGGFSVQLGQGTNTSGDFDADLFSEVDRWLEVVVREDVLSPRQIIGSVPWALVAERANEVVRDPDAPRFEDCGNGTVADLETGLQWEKKTGTTGFVRCKDTPCPDPHVAANGYQWATSGGSPNGGVFTDFLAKLNDPVFGAATTPDDTTGCFAGHCDWRLPTIVELQTILDCSYSPCIDPIFGVTSSTIHWSASTLAGNDLNAWSARFDNAEVNAGSAKGFSLYVRAVRAGSCP